MTAEIKAVPSEKKFNAGSGREGTEIINMDEETYIKRRIPDAVVIPDSVNRTYFTLPQPNDGYTKEL